MATAYPILLKHSGVHLTNIDEPIYTRIRQVIYPEDIAEIGLESIYIHAPDDIQINKPSCGLWVWGPYLCTNNL